MSAFCIVKEAVTEGEVAIATAPDTAKAGLEVPLTDSMLEDSSKVRLDSICFNFILAML